MPDAHIEIPAETGAIEAYSAWPEGGATAPAVLVLSDSRGLDGGLKGLVRTLATQGFFALAPDLFHRDGPLALHELADEALADDFDAWFDYLGHERRVDDERVGVVGYGVGGAVALRLAADHGERIAAVASFYGGGPAGPAARDLAERLNAVVHLGYPADDLWLLAPMIAEFEAALSEAGVDFETEFYPGRHGFAVEGGPGYQPRAARLHWTRLTDLLQRALRPWPEKTSGTVEPAWRFERR